MEIPTVSGVFTRGKVRDCVYFIRPKTLRHHYSLATFTAQDQPAFETWIYLISQKAKFYAQETLCATLLVTVGELLHIQSHRGK